MRDVLLHFALGAGGSLLILLFFTWRTGERSFSLPSASLVVGLACALLAHFATPWATPAVLALYALASWREQRLDRDSRTSGDDARIER